MTATLEVYGDVLEVKYVGSGLWLAESNGCRYNRAEKAMRQELEYYLLASGADLEVMAEEIDAMLETVEVR